MGIACGPFADAFVPSYYGLSIEDLDPDRYAPGEQAIAGTLLYTCIGVKTGNYWQRAIPAPAQPPTDIYACPPDCQACKAEEEDRRLEEGQRLLNA